MDPIVVAFITGLTTGGLSCLAVQGGLLASSVALEVEQSIQNQPAKVQRAKIGTTPQPQPVQPRAALPIVLFLTAKLVAYTLLGFMLGLAGAVLQLTPMMRAILLTAIGIFMIGNALRMLNVHPIFRYFLIEPPSSVTRYIRRKSKSQANALTPLFLGTLTVLIPCGVTQAMMAVAMGTGNPWTGAAILFAFVLGTSPVFFSIAYLTTKLGARLEKNFIRIVAVIMIILGLVSIDGGLTLAGFPYSVSNMRMAAKGSEPAPTATVAQPAAQEAVPGARTAAAAQEQKPLHATEASRVTGAFGPAAAASGVVTINVKNDGYQPEVTHARPGQPFRLALVTDEVYSCSRAFVIPSLKVEEMLPATGTVTVDIPPQPAGSRLFYSCSMGMYSGVIVFDG
jgi:sulfite exporter TauE/SafE